MLKPIFLSFFLATLSYGAEFDLTKVSLNEIQTYEKKFLATLKKENTPASVIQEKYLIAAKKFSEIESHDEAYYLLKNGFTISEPSIEYVAMYLTYIQNKGLMSEYNRIFKSTILKVSSERYSKFSADDINLASEHIVVFMRINNIHSSMLPAVQRKILEQSEMKESIRWNDSIISARMKNYGEALKFLEEVTIIGEGDNLYKSFLQAKLGQLPKFCLSIVANPQKYEAFYFKKTCKLIASQDSKKNLEEQIRATGELLEFTPLYEAISK